MVFEFHFLGTLGPIRIPIISLVFQQHRLARGIFDLLPLCGLSRHAYLELSSSSCVMTVLIALVYHCRVHGFGDSGTDSSPFSSFNTNQQMATSYSEPTAPNYFPSLGRGNPFE